MAMNKVSLLPCIKELSAKNTDYKFPEQAINQAESLKSLSSDLYTDNIRFIYELIQNADDAQAKSVNLAILDNKYLIITHDGKTFDEKDLQGLCGINNGTKKKDLDKTGYKGLGFKAVFGKSNYVLIYSNGEYFRFDSSHKLEWEKEWGAEDQQTWEEKNDRQFIYPWQINPIYTNENEVPNPIKNFLNSHKDQIHVANIIQLKNIDEILLAIQQLKEQPHMFLFLRNTSQITFTIQSRDIIFIDRSSDVALKKVYYNDQILSEWITKRYELDVPNDIREKLIKDNKAPEKLQTIKKAEMFFAAKYNDQGTIEKLDEKESHLFSYLPTKIFEYIFPVLINANFLTNVNREQIHTDSVWNQWLFDRIGIKLFEWIKELVSNDRYGHQAYKLLPNKLNLTNNNLSTQFNNAYDWSIQNCNFIRNRQNQLLTVNEVIMDSTSMSEQASFINIDTMRQYVINEYKSSSFQCAEHPFINDDLNLREAGVRQFTWHNCIEMFKSDLFTKTHSIEQNKQMIEYFYRKYSSINPNEKIDINIEQIPFLLDQNNHLQLIKNIYLLRKTSSQNNVNDLFVHEKIFTWLNNSKQKQIKDWLQKLGVIEQTDLNYLHKTIIPTASTYITHENAIKTIKVLFNLFENDSIGKKELDQLKKLKLLTTNRRLIPAEECFFSDQYNPRLKLEQYLKTQEDKFLNYDYVTNDVYRTRNDDLKEWRRFFSMLGVREELHLIEFSQKLERCEAIKYGFDEKYLRKNFEQYRDVHCYSGLITITFLQHTKDNYEFAKIFWKYVIQNIKFEKVQQKNLKIYWGQTNKPGANDGTVITYQNYIQWFITNIKCLPTTLNTCDLSKEIFIHNKEMKDLCGNYLPFPSIPFLEDKTDWCQLFNFKTKLDITNYFHLFQKIRQDEKHFKENFDRLQLLYSDLLENMKFYSSYEQSYIKSQEPIFYLLSENNQWKLVKDLFIFIDNNQSNGYFSNIIDCLKLNFNNQKHTNLQKFANLFGITQITINDLNFNYANSSLAEQFKFEDKLIDICPFIKKWLHKLSFSSSLISSIDEIVQQDTQFIEVDYLKFSFKGKLIQEKHVHFDRNEQKFYLVRPWNSEITFIDLPNKLCQLLNIKGFEDNLRFLLKVEKEDIRKYFQNYSIEIPNDKDIVKLETIPSALDVKIDPSSINKETITDRKVNDSQASKNATSISENSVNPIFNTNTQNLNMSLHHVGHVFLPLLNKETDDENIQVINLSEIEALDRKVNTIEGNPSLKQRITGDIGEWMVYSYLQKKYANSNKPVSIQWVNENQESNLSYDILLIKNGKKFYIEVKSTETINKNEFLLSINQIESILQHRQYYSIYRVYIQTKKLIILNNIRQRLENQDLTCLLSINSQIMKKTFS